MKHFLTMIILCAFLNANAQLSNPYNDNAIAIINKLQTVLPDLQSERVSDFTQQKINTYIQRFNTSSQTNINDATQSQFSLSEEILAEYISKYNNYSSVISTTDFSITTKAFLQTLQTPESLAANFDYVAYNSQVASSDITNNEKEILLTISALRYNTLNSNVGNDLIANRNSNQESGCDVGGNHFSPLGCGMFYGAMFAGLGAAGGGGPIGAGVGFVVGFTIAFFGSK